MIGMMKFDTQQNIMQHVRLQQKKAESRLLKQQVLLSS